MLFFSHGDWPTATAAFVMIVFHLNILLAFPMGVPLEWNVFMIFGVLWLFVAHAQLGLSSVTDPVPLAVLFVLIAGTVVIGTCTRARFPSCPACATTPAIGTPPCGVSSRPSTKSSAWVRARLAHVPHTTRAAVQDQRGNPGSDSPRIRIPGNEHRRARAVHPGAPGAGQDTTRTTTTCARVKSSARWFSGWNFGDGHMHNECLIEALQERCGFEPGDVRVVILDAQPISNSGRSRGRWSTRRRVNSSAAWPRRGRRYGHHSAVGR